MGDDDTAIGCDHANRRAATVQVGRDDPPADAALDHDGEVDPEPTIDGPRFQPGAIAVGDHDGNTAVGGLNVQPSARPFIPAQRYPQPTVRRPPANVSAYVGEVNATVGGTEVNIALYVGDTDATVHGLEGEI